MRGYFLIAALARKDADGLAFKQTYFGGGCQHKVFFGTIIIISLIPTFIIEHLKEWRCHSPKQKDNEFWIRWLFYGINIICSLVALILQVIALFCKCCQKNNGETHIHIHIGSNKIINRIAWTIAFYPIIMIVSFWPGFGRKLANHYHQEPDIGVIWFYVFMQNSYGGFLTILYLTTLCRRYGCDYQCPGTCCLCCIEFCHLQRVRQAQEPKQTKQTQFGSVELVCTKNEQHERNADDSGGENLLCDSGSNKAAPTRIVPHIMSSTIQPNESILLPPSKNHQNATDTDTKQTTTKDTSSASSTSKELENHITNSLKTNISNNEEKQLVSIIENENNHTSIMNSENNIHMNDDDHDSDSENVLLCDEVKEEIISRAKVMVLNKGGKQVWMHIHYLLVQILKMIFYVVM